eukprot:scaffold15.g4328.t1
MCSPTPSRLAQAAPVRASASTAELPQSLKSLVESFQAVPDPMARYKQLLFYATKLEKLPVELHTKENKVQGCVSQVWVVPELRADGRVYWKADSDSQLTKGLAALLVQGLSGCTPAEVVAVPPDFVAMLGLQQALTPSRNNGFLNMFKLMQRRSLELLTQQAAGAGPSSSGNGAAAGGNGARGAGAGAAAAAAAEAGPSATPVADSMRRKLTNQLNPAKLHIVNESDRHTGHAGHFGSAAATTGETHFALEIVSPEFEGLSTIKRHRLVYQILEGELQHPVHALSLVTKTPEEADLA